MRYIRHKDGNVHNNEVGNLEVADTESKRTGRAYQASGGRRMRRKGERNPKTREEIIADGVEAMTHSIMELIEPCIRQRCKQFVELIDERLAAKDPS